MIKKRFLGMSLAVAMLAITLPAFAGWEIHKGANVKFHVPDTWDMNIDGPVLITSPPKTHKHPRAAVEFVAITHGTKEVERVERNLMAQLEAKFTEVKITRKAKKVKQHGIDGVVFGGTAKAKDGEEVDWASAILGTGPETGIAVLVFGTPAALKAHKGALDKTLNSIQPNK